MLAYFALLHSDILILNMMTNQVNHDHSSFDVFKHIFNSVKKIDNFEECGKKSIYIVLRDFPIGHKLEGYKNLIAKRLT